jgi:hypothetical protein
MIIAKKPVFLIVDAYLKSKPRAKTVGALKYSRMDMLVESYYRDISGGV